MKWSLLALLLVYAACFWPLLLGKLFLYGDLGNFHLPLRLFYHEALQEGFSPLWLPNLFCGFYLFAEGQAGMAHPVHLALYRLLPIGPAFALECTLAYPFAVLGATRLFEGLGLSRVPALCGGVAFGFATFLMVRYTHVNVVAVIAHVPWLLLLVTIAATTRRPGVRRNCWVGTALLVASQVLLGYPGALVFSFAYLGLYAVVFATAKRNWRLLAWLGTASLVGLAIGGVQLIPTYEAFADSQRADTSQQVKFALSLHPWNLLQALAPYLYRYRSFSTEVANPIEEGFYFGAAFPIALTWICVRWRSLGLELRRPLVVCAVACAISLSLAFGSHAGVLPWFADLPLLGQLRVPARFTLLWHFAAAGVIAVAVADLLRVAKSSRADRRALRWLCFPPGLATVVALVGLAGTRSSEANEPLAGALLAGPLAIASGPALFVVCAAIFHALARGARTAPVLLVAFIAADSATWAVSLWWSEPPESVEDYLASVRVPVEPGPGRIALGYDTWLTLEPDGDMIFRAATREIVHGNRLLWGYAGLSPRKRVRPYSEAGFALGAVTHVRRNGLWFPLDAPLSRFRFVDEARVSADPRRDVEDIDVRRSALVEVPVSLEAGPRGSVHALSDLPGAIDLAVEAPTRQLLLISESHHPGWRVQVDAAPAVLLRTYGDYMGVVVERGEHELSLRFEPQDLRVGAALSGLGLVLLGVGAAVRPAHSWSP